MEIANPIYDVVFKYLMEDNRVAKLFLSAVTGLDIVELDFLPQELSSEKKDGEEVSEEEKHQRTIISALDLSIYRTADHHIMNVKELDFPEKFRPIIRRLQAAAQEKDVRDTMTIEDDFIAELNDYEHRIAEAERRQAEALRQQAQERSLKEEALRKQEEERRQKEEAVKLLLSLGMPAAEVAEKLGLELGYVEQLGDV